MKPKYTTQEIVESIKSHPLRWEMVTLESGLSWPVLILREDKLLLSFFYYAVGGPVGNRSIWYPNHRVIADPNSLSRIEFIPVEAKDFGINRIAGQPLAKQD